MCVCVCVCKWMCVISFTPRPLHSRSKISRLQLKRAIGGLYSRPEHLGKEKVPLLARKRESSSPCQEKRTFLSLPGKEKVPLLARKRESSSPCQEKRNFLSLPGKEKVPLLARKRESSSPCQEKRKFLSLPGKILGLLVCSLVPKWWISRHCSPLVLYVSQRTVVLRPTG